MSGADRDWRERLLDERTARLARPAAKQESAGTMPDAPRLLLCHVGTETHGIALETVETVMPFRGATPIPGAAPGIRGLVNHQGRFYRVLDTAALLGLAPAAESGGQHLVLLRHDGAGLALLVERAERAVATDASAESGHIPLATDTGQAIARLDLDKLLDHLPRNRI